MNRSIRCILGIVAFGLATVFAAAADAVFVVNGAGPDSVSKEDVRNILLGNKTKWDGGGVIRLAVLASGPAHEAVVQGYTARSPDQFEKFWKKQVFTGKGVAPDVFTSDADMLGFIAKTPGAFGYVAGGTPPAGAKIIKVQ